MARAKAGVGCVLVFLLFFHLLLHLLVPPLVPTLDVPLLELVLFRT